MGLLSLLQGNQEYDENGQPISDATAPQPAAQADTSPNEVSAVTVEPTRKKAPAPPPQTSADAYDNSGALAAIRGVAQKADSANQFGDGLGLANILHAKGTLRSVLGTLGDAFLIQAGKDPIHSQQIYRQQIADAAAGFQDNPMLAASRIAGTGAPGSMEMADKMFGQANTQGLKEATLQNNQAYRDSLMDNRRDALVNRFLPQAGGVLNKAKDASDYADRAAMVLQSARRLDPSIQSISDLGFPEEYDPDFKGGMTAGQVARDDRTGQTIDQRSQIADTTHQDRVRGQDLTNSAAMARVGVTKRGQDISNSNQAANRQQRTDLHNTPKAGAKPPIKPIGGGAQTYTHTATGPNGQKMGWNGKQWVPIK